MSERRAREAATPVEEVVREILRSRSPLARGRAELPGELRLGAGGLGLDSIALVEVLLECERRFGVAAAAELLQGESLTVRRLVAHLCAAAAG